MCDLAGGLGAHTQVLPMEVGAPRRDSRTWDSTPLNLPSSSFQIQMAIENSAVVFSIPILVFRKNDRSTLFGYRSLEKQWSEGLST